MNVSGAVVARAGACATTAGGGSKEQNRHQHSRSVTASPRSVYWLLLPPADRQRRAAVVTGRQRERVGGDLPVPRPIRGQRAAARGHRGRLAFEEVGERAVLQIDDRPPVGRDDAVTHVDARGAEQIRRGLVGPNLHPQVAEVVVVQDS